MFRLWRKPMLTESSSEQDSPVSVLFQLDTIILSHIPPVLCAIILEYMYTEQFIVYFIKANIWQVSDIVFTNLYEVTKRIKPAPVSIHLTPSSHIIVTSEYVYVITDVWNNSNGQGHMYKLDPAIGVLTKFPTRNVVGSGCGVYNDTVYLIGGMGITRSKPFMIDYNGGHWADPDSIRVVITDVWRWDQTGFILDSTLTLPRMYPAVISVYPYLYCIGGNARDPIIGCSMERYDGVKWELIDAEMVVPRQDHAAILHRNLIIVAGGMTLKGDGIKPTSTVEVYDLTTHQWRFGGCLVNPHPNPQLLVYQDRVFCTDINHGWQEYDLVTDTFIPSDLPVFVKWGNRPMFVYPANPVDVK